MGRIYLGRSEIDNAGLVTFFKDSWRAQRTTLTYVRLSTQLVATGRMLYRHIG